MFWRSLTCQNSHVDISSLDRLDWLISMQCSHKTLHFLSVSDGLTSILSDIVISLRKSHEIIFVTYWKTKNICERCFWDVSETSRKRHLLRYARDVLKTSQKRHLFWDVSEMFLRYLSQWRSDLDLSETSHAGWEGLFKEKFFS